MSCLLEVRWRGHCCRMLGMEGRFKFQLSGIGDGVGGVGVMMKEELCENVVGVTMVTDRVMVVLLVTKMVC